MQPEICAVGDSNTSVVAKAARPASPQWNSATKIAFRFAFVYFSLYNFYLPLHFLPFPPFSQIFALYSWACSLAVRLVSLRVLHLSHNFATDYLNTSAGSKDTTFDYVEVLCFFVISVLATVIWSLLDRRRPNYQWLYKWFIVFLRLALAAAMIPYGAAKIFPSQFPEPALSKLLQPYGDSSPTDLFWTFMGASRTYSAFGGATEVLAGILLVVPRLATLGALVATAVMTNVLMLNVGYDVAVKLRMHSPDLNGNHNFAAGCVPVGGFVFPESHHSTRAPAAIVSAGLAKPHVGGTADSFWRSAAGVQPTPHPSDSKPSRVSQKYPVIRYLVSGRFQRRFPGESRTAPLAAIHC